MLISVLVSERAIKSFVIGRNFLFSDTIRGAETSAAIHFNYMVGAEDVGAVPEEVRAEVLALLDEVRDARGGNPLTVAVYLHAVLENIHPSLTETAGWGASS